MSGDKVHQIAIYQDAVQLSLQRLYVQDGYRITKNKSLTFKTVTELIGYYRTQSLQRHFHAVATPLCHPCGKLGMNSFLFRFGPEIRSLPIGLRVRLHRGA
jgi:hypothetical protein